MRPSRSLRRLAALLTLATVLAPWSTQPAGAGPARPASGEDGSGPPSWKPRATDNRLAPLAAESVRWADVPRDHWARTAIDYVAERYDWMRDFQELEDGTTPFKPGRLEPRKLLARAVVRSFAPDEATDPDITFDDLRKVDRFWRFANVAVKLGWMRRVDGGFAPDDPVTTLAVHRVLVLALGLRHEAVGLDRLHTRDGHRFDTPPGFGTLLIGMRLGLRYNHSDESLDVEPHTELSRAEVAWSLYRAATVPDWALESMTAFGDIELPKLSAAKREVVQFGIRYVGYPYVWGGEWNRRTPAGYCCGAQPVGGFDCSGWTWWIVKEASGGWDNTPPRDYRGWNLPQRTSADMASSGTRLGWRNIVPGDLLFYDGSGDGTVDHVDVYIGNGWALDSSSSSGGVTIMDVSSGWYRDHFHHARRII